MKFKFLLAAVNAKYIHSNPAIYSLRAYAGEELRQYVELAEYTINQSMQEILADIYHRKPSVIGFSCYIWNWRLIQELLAELPKVLPDIAIWLGGPEVSYDAGAIMKQYPWLAGIMIGEGEATFRELLAHYVKLQPKEMTQDRGGGRQSEGKDLGRGLGLQSKEESHGRGLGLRLEGESHGRGLGLQSEEESQGSELWAPEEGKIPVSGGGIQETVASITDIKGLYLADGYTPFRPLTDMNDIPFLYDDLTPFENKIIYYETSRGCPFRCSYCLSSIEKTVRFRDINIVKKELQFFLDHRVKQVKFVDRTFNCNHEHAMAIWQYIHEHDNGITNFHFEISADILREDEIALLRHFRPGLAQLEIGVQSVNMRTLQAMKRVTDLEKLEEKVAAVRKGKNIHQHLDLIVGLPYEDYESFKISFQKVYYMQPEQLQLGFLKVLKGSEMWERAEEYGICYQSQPPYEVLSTKWLSYEEVLRLKGIEEMVELYYNSAQFTHTLPFLEKAFPDSFTMYEALADFYQQKGYFSASPARAYRYQILLAFAMEWDETRLAAYRELLTYDMYLRENLKSRPEFARDIGEWKSFIRDFYQKEECSHQYLPDYVGYDWKQLSKMTHLEPFAYPVWDVEQMVRGYERWGSGGVQGEVEDWGSGGIQGEAEYWGYGGSLRKDEIEKYGGFVLFDYRKRNPLNHEAAVRCVTPCVVQTGSRQIIS